MSLKGDMMLVEKLPKIEKKTTSGIIIASTSTYKQTMGDADAEFGVVLMVGPGQILDDGTILQCDCKPGDVILLPGNVTWYSQFGHMSDYEPYTIGRLRDSQVGMTFTDYKRCFEVLNEV
jgi:co-chaperonin GroES (HSP10)